MTCGNCFRWVWLWGVAALAVPARAADGPEFKEVYELLRSHAGSLTEAELNRAAVAGLLTELSSRAWLINSSKATAPDTNVAPVSSTALFDESYGYVRIGRVGGRLPEEFSASLEKL